MMKFYALFKQPDVIEDTINVSDTDEEGAERIRQVMEKYVYYGEYVRVEFDMTTGAATVTPVD